MTFILHFRACNGALLVYMFMPVHVRGYVVFLMVDWVVLILMIYLKMMHFPLSHDKSLCSCVPFVFVFPSSLCILRGDLETSQLTKWVPKSVLMNV